jgi:hypothetical protein
VSLKLFFSFSYNTYKTRAAAFCSYPVRLPQPGGDMKRIAAVLLLMACGGDSGPSAPSVDLTGNWAGKAGNPSGQMSWAITQSGSSISGNFSYPGLFTNAGTVSGTLSGTKLTFTLTHTTGFLNFLGCSSSVLSGNANTVTQTNISGSFSGSLVCPGKPTQTVSGPITLNR